jgi:superfamily II DNA helicase RecQ
LNTNKDAKVQYKSDRKPSEWTEQHLTNEHIHTLKYKDQGDDIKQAHYTHLHAFLDREIKVVVTKQTQLDNIVTDDIDAQVITENKAVFY